MKRISDRLKVSIAFGIILVIAISMDVSHEAMKNGVIEREEIGGDEKELQLQLDIEGVLENYPYVLEILPVVPTKEEAEVYFTESIGEINSDFAHIKTEVPLNKSYCEGVVKADWKLQPFGIVDTEGKININKLQEETIMQAQVELTCGTYNRIYAFSFLLKKPELSEKEQLLQQIQAWLELQMAQEGSTNIELPINLNGKELVWSEKREYITPQIVLLEGMALVFLWYFSKRKKKEDEKKCLLVMEKEYADVVSQLSLLLGAGMTTKQAWNRITKQYKLKRTSQLMSKNVVYEAISRMSGRLAEGMSERVVYQQFCEEIPAACYYKLMRILLGNLEKGTQGIGIRLEEESRLAFEQKIILAKKQGEEMSTKMLVPLMFMLMLVMGIIMLPALISFQI